MMKVNKQKYTEIYDTLPLIEPLKSILGPYGLTQNCDLILQVTYKPPPVLHPDIIEFIDHLKMDDCISDNPPIRIT